MISQATIPIKTRVNLGIEVIKLNLKTILNILFTLLEKQSITPSSDTSGLIPCEKSIGVFFKKL